MINTENSGELILLPSLKAQRSKMGGVVITQKYLNGADEFAKNWPGKVTSLFNINTIQTTDLDHIEVFLSSSQINIEERPKSAYELAERLKTASVVLAFLSSYELETARICNKLGVKIAFTSEYTLTTEKQIIEAETSNPILRLRRKLWLQRSERKKLMALALSSGLQCSGLPTYSQYKSICSNPILFFDNRVSVSNVITERELESKLTRHETNKPLRLVFGGRLIPMKGATELPKVAAVLKSLDIPFSMKIYGGGPLEATLKKMISKYDLGSHVELKGIVDFETHWIPLLKNEADLFVCCHTQGDPSSTYPEVMSCGVPIVGYGNEAFRGIVENSKSGWIANTFDYHQIANIISSINSDRNLVIEHAKLGQKFALRHAFEPTFLARTKHLIDISGNC